MVQGLEVALELGKLCLKIDLLCYAPNYSAVFPLRAGLIHAAKMHEYLISLHSAYESCP